MRKIMIAVSAVICAALLTGCGKNSGNESGFSLSEILENFQLSEMLDNYKGNFLPSDQRGVQIPQYSDRNITDPHDKKDDSQPYYRGHSEPPTKPGYNGKIPDLPPMRQH